jgi:hypothetical protein
MSPYSSRFKSHSRSSNALRAAKLLVSQTAASVLMAVIRVPQGKSISLLLAARNHSLDHRWIVVALAGLVDLRRDDPLL